MPEPIPLSVVQTPHVDEKPLTLDAAFEKALAFSPATANKLILSDETLSAHAEEEASYGEITVDRSGITAGMNLHIVQPARDMWVDWGLVKGAFMTALKPVVKDIDAFETLEKEIDGLKIRRLNVKGAIEEQALSNQRYSKIKTRYEKAKSRFEEMSERQGHRPPTLAANSWWYWIAIFAIGGAEWLINYDIFEGFLGVPAIAAGSTIILGALLAFAAHAHGMLFKQWGSRFGDYVDRNDKLSDLRLLALASFSLTLVLGAAGGSRYAAVMHDMAANNDINILGSEAAVAANPVRDVLLSLLANVAAWAVGVFISYLTHDKDYQFMESAQEKKSADEAYENARRPFSKRIATEEAKIEREINEKERSAAARAHDVQAQREMRNQVLEHEVTVETAIVGAIRRNAEFYKGKLSAAALAAGKSLIIKRDGVQITPYEYKAKPIVVSTDILRKISA